jgi:hypothetical protein
MFKKDGKGPMIAEDEAVVENMERADKFHWVLVVKTLDGQDATAGTY